VPLPLSVAGLGAMVPSLVPPVAVNTTTAPPVTRLFPTASFACNVSVAGAPESSTESDTVMNDVADEIAPGVTVTVGRVDVTGLPLMVARSSSPSGHRPAKVAV
jgi:hypothetical protein